MVIEDIQLIGGVGENEFLYFFILNYFIWCDYLYC